jgi:hypothetical protein
MRNGLERSSRVATPIIKVLTARNRRHHCHV